MSKRDKNAQACNIKWRFNKKESGGGLLLILTGTH